MKPNVIFNRKKRSDGKMTSGGEMGTSIQTEFTPQFIITFEFLGVGVE